VCSSDLVLSTTFTGTHQTVNLATPVEFIEASESTNNLANIRIEKIGNVFLSQFSSGVVARYTTTGINNITGSVNITLVGGGSGGQSGSASEGNSNSNNAGGVGGSSGKVVNLGPVTLVGGESVVIGAQGNGGSGAAKVVGNAGGATTLGNYTSANGNFGAGGSGASQVGNVRVGNPGSASPASNLTSNLCNNLLPIGAKTTGGGAAGSHNFGIGAGPGAGGGSGIGTGGAGGFDGIGGNATGFGGGGGGGGARFGDFAGGNGTPGVVYLVVE
jgi:hypothetical protein